MPDEAVVAVTNLEYAKGRSVFEAASGHAMRCVEAPSEESALAAFVKKHGIRHVIVGVEPYKEALYEAIPEGGVIARFGVGYDGLDLARAAEHGLLCTNTPGVLDESVAEQAVALMLAAARHVTHLDKGVHAGEWSPRLGVELQGKTLAVIGCGAIGSRVGRIAALGFGMQVLGCRRNPDAADLRGEFGFASVSASFEETVRDADFVSLHIPSVPETAKFLNETRLQAIPSHAWLINTARGAVVDESALYNALREGRLAGAALDVYAEEPYSPSDPRHDLRTIDNVIMTPHTGSSTVEACERMATRALENIVRASEARFGEMDLLNPDALKR